MVTRDSLAAEYLFNGTDDDSSGNGSHGIVHGAIPTLDRFGNPDSAYLFNGKDDYIVVSRPPRLGDNALTVSVWARWDASAFEGWNNCVICQDNGNDDERSRRIFQISTQGNRIVWHRMVEARDPTSSDRVRPNVWYHIAAVFEHGVHRFYVDGILTDASVHRLRMHREEPLYIGRKGTPEPYFFFNGAIDDIRLYSRALDDRDIQSLFEENGYRKQVRSALKSTKTCGMRDMKCPILPSRRTAAGKSA